VPNYSDLGKRNRSRESQCPYPSRFIARFPDKHEHIAASPNVHVCSKHLEAKEIIADNLSKAEWSWGCVSALDSRGWTIWIADAHRGDAKRLVVRADEKLTAFLELQRAIHDFAVSLIS
jgi:hypothetical protein